MTDKNLVVVDALYKHWLSPSSYITVSSEPRLYNPMRPELLVNSHINGTTIYVYASMVGSHDLIPFSPVHVQQFPKFSLTGLAITIGKHG